MCALPVRLPAGTYVSVANAVRLNKGGRTAVILMRARMLGELAGARSIIATVADVPDLAETRAELTARGDLNEHVSLVNVFEDYRQRTHALDGGEHALAPVPSGLVPTVETGAGGLPYRTTYRPGGSAADADPVVVDHQRDDGSVFLRTTRHDGRTAYDVVAPDGRVVRHHRSRSRLLHHWLGELVGDGDGFLITDSRKMVPSLLSFDDPRMHLVAAFHNPHTEQAGRWDAPLKGPYVPVLDNLASLDGLVLLTERQREEIALRLGRTENLFVAANPVVPPTLPDPRPARDPKRLVAVARLEAQKRVAHTLRALQVALDTDPELRLDVYGDGPGRAGLERTAGELGIAHAVTFHGYDPGARDRLLTASAFLVTSRYEGYPLATLEAMSRGCPVISYDIKFGPREQISEGVDGFLVPDGDVRTFADRILAITSDPERAARMSAAAYEKAAAHSPARFVEDWVQVFRAVKDQAATRVRIHGARLHGPGLRGDRLKGRLRMRVSGGSPTPDTATITVDVVGESTGDVVSFPVAFTPARLSPRVDGLALDATLDPRRTAEVLGDQPVRVRLMVAWHNAAWQMPLGSGSTADGLLRLDPDEVAAR
ncbi:glycosyltransferase [Mumia sp. DW29H23]|uniref:glycosyltransferase n=1 Tax=Mumia sp. DW29H23 TaxID=3421241 RepID=UPI003D681914